jgi:hypothetical protein
MKALKRSFTIFHRFAATGALKIETFLNVKGLPGTTVAGAPVS